MTKKPKKRQKQRFFGFGHFGQNGNFGSEIVNMSNKNPFWRGTPENFPLIGMGGVVFFEGSKNGSKNGQFLGVSEHPFFGTSWHAKIGPISVQTGITFLATCCSKSESKVGPKMGPVFGTPKKSEFTTFRFARPEMTQKSPFFTFFTVFVKKHPFLTLFVTFWDTATMPKPLFGQNRPKQAKNRPKTGSKKRVTFRTCQNRHFWI